MRACPGGHHHDKLRPPQSHVGDVTTETNATKSKLEALLETGVVQPAHQWKLLVSDEAASMEESLGQQEADLKSSGQLLSSFLLEGIKEDLPTGWCCVRTFASMKVA